MSTQATIATEDHVRYIAEHTTPEDDFLKRLKKEARAAKIPLMCISPEQGSFIQIQLKLAKAKDVIDVGTLIGYSAIVMARALPPDGRVRTIEISPERAEFAEKWIRRSDVADKIQVHWGAVRDVLAGFADNSADAALLDADKTGYPAYLEECLRIVRPGGLIMADNAFAFGELFEPNPTDPETPAIREFNEIMARETRVQGIIVPVGDGCWVAVNRKEDAA